MAIEGLTTKPSTRSVAETTERFSAVLAAKGIRIFAVIDHAAEAERAGLAMPPTRVVIFGNPKAGTPVMLAAPTIALELPLKVLVWEDAAGKVWVSFDDPVMVAARHHVPPALATNIAVVGSLVDAAL